MKKRLYKSLICFMLSVVMLTETNLGAIQVQAADVDVSVDEESEVIEEDVWGEDDEAMMTSNSYLYPFEEAVVALEELAELNNIMGVVYLADEITMRSLPNETSEPVKNLCSGDSVRVLGVGQDEGYAIWYRVSYQNEYEEVTGYIPKDNLACVDSDFLQWQESYVRSIGMFGNLRGGYNAADIEAFPESYQSGLYSLKQKHPNWIFVKMNTQVNWENMLSKQMGDKSWIHNSGIPESYKAGATSQAGWSFASKGIIRYYMDPRNWFSETYVFQFELLGYEAQYHTVNAVEELLKGSFMANAKIESNKTYAEAFVEIGRANDVSPLFLAARVLQEQGYAGNSQLISGTYPGYEGYYNYFNIGATGTGDKGTIENGLKKAKDKGWNSRYKAIKGGIEFLLVDYIKVGQNTLYLQKFDIIGTIANHQYMQNIKAPAQEASIVSKFYSNNGLLSQPYVFVIPVYNNMPAKACAKPGEEDKITISTTKIENLQVDSEVTLQALVNGKIVEGAGFEFTSSDKAVATVDAAGKVKALKAGETTITCKDMDDPENPNIGTCKITVIPADIDLTSVELPVLKAITYDPNKTLNEVKLPEGYTWVNPEIIPVVNQNSYAVVYSPNEEKYNPITFNLTLEVQKKVLMEADYTVPTDLIGAAGKELGSVSLPLGFYWNDPTESLANTIGTKQYLASYNPDISNYESATDIKITVTIVCEKHELGEWVITEATCEEDGSKVRTCSVCKYKEELILEKTGHSYEMEVTTEATEEAEGLRTYTCANCKDTYTESIPKLPSTHEHQYEEEVTKKASCTENGLKTYTCSCGDVYTEVIEAVGHNMENGHCKNCGHTEDIGGPKDDASDEEEPSKDTPSTDTGSNQTPGNAPSTDTGKEQEPGNAPSTDTGSDQTPGNAPSTDTGKEQTPDNTPVNPPTTDTGNSQTPNNTPTQNQGSDDKKEENNSVPPKTEEKVDVTVKNPTTSENKTEEPESVPSKAEEKVQEAVNETQVAGNQVELELMSNLVETVNEAETDAEKKTVSIQLNNNTEISHKIVEMAKEHGVDLEVSLPNELKWTIKSDSLGDGMPSAINLNAQIVNDVIEKEVIHTVVEEQEYIELSLSHDGVFGFEAVLTIPVEKKHVGQTANLFYFNEKTKELEFVMATPVDEEGNIALDFNHASDYIIVFAEKSMNDVIAIAETLNEEEAAASEIDKTTDDKQDNINKLLVICIFILVISGSIAVIGYLLYKRGDKKEEIEEVQSFEDWLKEDVQMNNKNENQIIAKEDEYLDDDQDDYREKEAAPSKTFHTGEIHLEEDYLDDDVDDYQEKN